MPKQLQFRRGTTAELASETGLLGELFVDTSKKTVVAMDGTLAGGHPLAKENDPNFTGSLRLGTTTAHVADNHVIEGTLWVGDTANSGVNASEIVFYPRYNDGNAASLNPNPPRIGLDLSDTHLEITSYDNLILSGTLLQLVTNQLELELSTGYIRAIADELRLTTYLGETVILTNSLGQTNFGSQIFYPTSKYSVKIKGKEELGSLFQGLALEKSMVNDRQYIDFVEAGEVQNGRIVFDYLNDRLDLYPQSAYPGSLSITSGGVGVGNFLLTGDVPTDMGGLDTHPNLHVNGTTESRLQVSTGITTIVGELKANSTIVQLGTVTSTDLILATTDTERMRIDSSGNVGIGTSSPDTKLHVQGQLRVADLSLNYGLIRTGIENNNFLIGYDSTHATTPNSIALKANAANGYVYLSTNSAERMRVTSTGGVSFGSSGTSYGTQDQVLVSNGNTAPSWNTLDLGYMPTAAFKKSVRVATTANITLSNATTAVDGVTLANGDRILVKNQTTDSQNGIYIVSTSGAWTRAPDADTADKIAAAIVVVDIGSQGGLTFTNTFKSSDTLGTTAMYWLLVSSTAYYRTNSTIAGGNDTTIRPVLGVAVTLMAGTVYEIEGAFYLNKTAGATSSFINFSLRAAGGLTANNMQVHVNTRFGAGVTAVEAVDNYGLITALNTNLACYAANTTAAVGLIVQYKGTISVNVAGTLAPSYSQSAASGGAWTANIGNYMKVVPLGAAGVIDIGPWA